MSKTSARHQALQEFLSARGYATIDELARHFEVTPQTVRKDINALAEEGKTFDEIIKWYYTGVDLTIKS